MHAKLTSLQAARRRDTAAAPRFALGPVMAGVLCALAPHAAHAQTPVVLPTQLQGGVVRGADAPSVVGNAMTINQTAQRGVIEWSNFNIGTGNSVTIQQPNASAVLLNRVIGNTSGSRIDGNLTANGRVMILDPSGLTFGRGSTVQVGSLIGAAMDLRTTPGVDPYAAFISSGDASLTQGAFQAQLSVETGASIKVDQGGTIALLASNRVDVRDTIAAPQGQVVIAAAGGADIPVGTSGFINLKLAPATQQPNAGYVAPSISIGSFSGVSAPGGAVRVEVSGDSAPSDGPPIAPSINHDGVIDTSSATGNGGSVTLQAGANGIIGLAGSVRAQGGTTAGSSGTGGTITIDGSDISLNFTLGADQSARLLADGATGGGVINVGSSNTLSLLVDTGALLSANAIDKGNGGAIAARATNYTAAPTDLEQARVNFGVAEIYGALSARGGPNGGNGGTIETAAAALAIRRFNGDAIDFGTFNAGPQAAGGQNGTWTIDGVNVSIGGLVPFQSPYTPGNSGTVVTDLDVSNAIDTGTNLTLSTGLAAKAGGRGGDVTLASNILIARGLGSAQGAFTVLADRDITLQSGAGIVSTAGEMSVNLLADRDGLGGGAITLLANNRIQTNGGSVLMSGGVDSASGFATDRSGLAGISLSTASVDTTSGGAVGSITLRGAGIDGEVPGTGIDLFQSTLTGNNLTLIGRAQSGIGVAMAGNSRLASATPQGAIDIRGIASGGIATPTGVDLSNTDITVQNGNLQILGRGSSTSTQNSAVGINFDGLNIVTAPTGTSTITIAGESEAQTGQGLRGGANNSFNSFNISAGTAGATGANIVIGGAAGNNGDAMAFGNAMPRINTTGFVNLRPLRITTTGGDADGALQERPGDGGITVGTPSTGVSTTFHVDTAWLRDANRDIGNASIITSELVIGSSLETAGIVLGANAIDSNSHQRITLQNQGSPAAGIVLEGNDAEFGAAHQLALLSNGAVRQTGAINVERLVLVGDGGVSSVTLDNPANQIGVLAFDPPRTISVSTAGSLTVDAAQATGYDVFNRSFRATNITTSQGADLVQLTSLGTETTIVLNQPIVMINADSQINLIAPGGLINNAGPTALTNGPAGRWQVWSTTWTNENRGGLAGNGTTPNLYGCGFTNGTTCSVSGVAIPGADNGFRYLAQPTATVTPTPVSFTQGSAVPPIDFTISGLINGDTPTGGFSGALGTTATSGSSPGSYPVSTGTLASRQGYALAIADASILPVTVLAPGDIQPPVLGPPPTSTPLRLLDLTPGSGRARGFDFDRLDFETSSEVNGRNLSRSLMCLAPGALRRQAEAGEGVDTLGMEWGRVRNQPHLSSCLELGDDNQCAAF